MRGLHRLFIGDELVVATRNGLVHLVATEAGPGATVRATLTPGQADELAADLQAYAAHARVEAEAGRAVAP